ncbi:hypothetical protein D3C85_1117300 [compost metagenome]
MPLVPLRNDSAQPPEGAVCAASSTSLGSSSLGASRLSGVCRRESPLARLRERGGGEGCIRRQGAIQGTRTTLPIQREQLFPFQPTERPQYRLSSTPQEVALLG